MPFLHLQLSAAEAAPSLPNKVPLTESGLDCGTASCLSFFVLNISQRHKRRQSSVIIPPTRTDGCRPWMLLQQNKHGMRFSSAEKQKVFPACTPAHTDSLIALYNAAPKGTLF